MKRVIKGNNEFALFLKTNKLLKEPVNDLQGYLFSGTEYAGDYKISGRGQEIFYTVTVLCKFIKDNQMHLYEQ